MSLFLLFLLISYFLFFPQDAFEATQEGILLWFTQVLPTLLPFSVFSYVFMESNALAAIGRRLPEHIPLYDIYILFCGFLFGFPIGSKLSADFYKKGLISGEQAQILCTFTNNLSPMFISSYVLSQNLKQPEWILPAYGIVYLPPFFLCVIMLYAEKRRHAAYGRLKADGGKSSYAKYAGADSSPAPVQKNKASRFHLNMQIIDAGIINGFELMIKLCGYIVLFRIVIAMLELLPLHSPLFASLLFGFTEVTNGIAYLSKTMLSADIKYMLSIGILTFGGFCGIAQTGSMIADTGLSLKKYAGTKVILTVITMAFAALFLLLA